MRSHIRGVCTATLALALSLPLAATPSYAQDVAPAADAVEPGEVLWSENFDQLADKFGPRFNDPGIEPDAMGFTHEVPTSWARQDDGFSGGVEEWAGWSFTTRDFWTDADLQRRQWFSGAHDVIAVADSDEWADGGSPTGTMDTGITTPPIDIAGHDRVQLEFNSHYATDLSQKAQVLASFDGSEPLAIYDVSTEVRQSAREEIIVDVPSGAQQVEFTWRYFDAYNNWFWAIDDLSLTVPLPEHDPSEGVIIDMLSDIQGDNAGYRDVMKAINEMPRASAASVINGDVTNTGTEAQISEFLDSVAQVPPASDRLLYNFGNHDAGVGIDVGQERFLAYAGRDEVWGEEMIDGVPLLFVTTDRYLLPGQYEEQLAWLEERLDYHAASGMPVLVAAHHNLKDSVSGSYASNYSGQWSRPDEFTDILGRYANAILFTSHTHWDLGLDDWYARVAFPGGDPRGVPIFNTGSIQTKWGPSSDTNGTGETNYGAQFAQGLRVEVLDDRVRVEAHDFSEERIVQTVEIPISAPQAVPALAFATSPEVPDGAAGWYVTPPVFSLESTGHLTDAEVRIADGEWEPYTDAVSLAVDGTSTVTMRGTVDGWQIPEQSLTIALDTADPISSASINDAARLVALRGLDATSGLDRVEYRSSGEEFVPYEAPIDVGDAATVIEFRAVDTAGNVEPTNRVSLAAVGDPGTEPGTDPGTAPGTDPGTDPGTGSGEEPDSDTAAPEHDAAQGTSGGEGLAATGADSALAISLAVLLLAVGGITLIARKLVLSRRTE